MFNFCGGMQDFGRDVLKTLVQTDYGPGCSFDNITGHGLEDHHGGSHEQVNLYKKGVSGSGIAFRFFDAD